MPHDHAIRTLGAHEWRRYRDLRLQALAESPDVFVTTLADARARSDADWQRMVSPGTESPPQVALVADAGTRPVGMAWCQVDDGNRSRAQLFQMWVRPDFRRQGIARDLGNAAIRWAASEGVEEILLSVPVLEIAAVGLYEDLGFRPVGPAQPLRPGSEALAQGMRRGLRAAGSDTTPRSR